LLQILNSAGATALAEPQQAALIPFLLKQQPSKTILLVAGEKLIECQPASDRLTAIPVPPEIGLLRSVSTISLDGRLQTAVGGQRGVALLGDAPATLLARTASERGFNAVTVNTLLRQIVATHGEFGLMRWSLNHGPTPEPIAVAGTPRHLTSVDERIVFAVDQRLFVLDGDYVRLVYTADELILKLIVMSDALIIVCRSGVLERLNRSTFALISRFSRRSLLTAAAGADVEGLQLIFLVGEAGPVAAFAPDGTLRLELHSPYAGLRMLSIAGGYIVGVSADRQHLVTWQGWSPAAPLRATNIVAQSGHRISDLAVR
ncbi:MAG TPA: hypothetical protein VGB55_01660, partial [Tepidisphaeraceae bacterium]